MESRIIVSILSLMLVLSIAGYKTSGKMKWHIKGRTLNVRNVDPSLIYYFLWTREKSGNSEYHPIRNGDVMSLESSGFDGSLKTYILLHGYNDEALNQWILDSKTALLSIENCNVLAVQYKDFVRSPNYVKAVFNMYEVAAITASFIDVLVEGYGLSTSRIHIIGHSLGAHTAGMTAFYVTTGEIDRVTGLDPAGPLFKQKGSDRRLDKSQASFVDVIHSNGCSLFMGCQGLYKPIGDVDFYPNGGRYQNGCPSISFFDEGCSHKRASSLWIESITAGTNPSQPKTFVSWPCQDWDAYMSKRCQDCGQGCLNMGFNVERNLKGTYFLATKDSSPYALGTDQIPYRLRF